MTRAVAVMLLVLLSPATGIAQTTVDVQMVSFAFSPSVVIINVGDTVRWTNLSTGVRHTATADGRQARRAGFNSGSLPSHWLSSGQTFQFTFTTSGTFPYHCIPHRFLGMVGTVIVSGTTAPHFFFVAAAEEGRVVLRWRVAGNAGRVGFHVLRSTGWEREFVRVNAALVPDRGDPSAEAEYEFIDESVASGTEYFYVLEEVDSTGKLGFRGPAIVVTRR